MDRIGVCTLNIILRLHTHKETKYITYISDIDYDRQILSG